MTEPRAVLSGIGITSRLPVGNPPLQYQSDFMSDAALDSQAALAQPRIAKLLSYRGWIIGPAKDLFLGTPLLLVGVFAVALIENPSRQDE
jgi:hypothetical protein